jgi:hypothetical protein
MFSSRCPQQSFLQPHLLLPHLPSPLLIAGKTVFYRTDDDGDRLLLLEAKTSKRSL